MANRPVFMTLDNPPFCERKKVDFTFYSGFSLSQKQKSIESLHNAFLSKYPERRVLEISTSSTNELGNKLSAFNLKIHLKNGQEVYLESVFQSGKVFENGGPYKDLFYKDPRTAKKDRRIRESGRIIRFVLNGNSFPTEPKTFFYNWLYINALSYYEELIEELVQYDSFTDISFNPQKSINCQAEACAIFVALYKFGLLEDALSSKESFLHIVYPDNEQMSFL